MHKIKTAIFAAIVGAMTGALIGIVLMLILRDESAVSLISATVSGAIVSAGLVSNFD